MYFSMGPALKILIDILASHSFTATFHSSFFHPIYSSSIKHFLQKQTFTKMEKLQSLPHKCKRWLHKELRYTPSA